MNNEIKDFSHNDIQMDAPTPNSPKCADTDMNFKIEETDTDYKVIVGRLKIHLPKSEGTDRFVSVEKEDRAIFWKYMPRSTSQHENAVVATLHYTENNPLNIDKYFSVKYEKADDSTALQYDISNKGIKESIIFGKDPACKVFSFEIKLKGLIPMLTEDEKNIFLIQDDADFGDEIPEFKIPPSFMEDANGAFCDDMHYEIHKTKEGTFLHIVLDTDWLSNSERSYPVIIDPHIEIL